MTIHIYLREQISNICICICDYCLLIIVINQLKNRVSYDNEINVGNIYNVIYSIFNLPIGNSSWNQESHIVDSKIDER